MNSRRIIIMLSVILGINIILAIVFRDFIRENVLIPILYLFWYIKLFLRSLGETCLYPLILAILAVIALRIINSRKKSLEKEVGYTRERSQYGEGRVGFWMKYIRRRAMGFENLNYVSFRLKELTLSVLAYEENLTSSEMENEITRGRIKTPAVVQRFLLPGEQEDHKEPESPDFLNRIISWFKTRSVSQVQRSSSDIYNLVQYLEEQLEIDHGNGNN